MRSAENTNHFLPAYLSKLWAFLVGIEVGDKV